MSRGDEVESAWNNFGLAIFLMALIILPQFLFTSPITKAPRPTRKEVEDRDKQQ